MCRHNHLWGGVLMALGAGILLGTWLEGGFLSRLIAVVLMLVGIAVAKK